MGSLRGDDNRATLKTALSPGRTPTPGEPSSDDGAAGEGDDGGGSVSEAIRVSVLSSHGLPHKISLLDILL